MLHLVAVRASAAFNARGPIVAYPGRTREPTRVQDELPFLPHVLRSDVLVRADFLDNGDLDADGSTNVVAAERDGDTLYLLSGTGRGGLEPARPIRLAGRLTALTCP